MDRLEELVAPGFRFTAIHLNPEPMTREQWMDAAREGYTIVSFAYESHGHRRVRRHRRSSTARYSQVASYQHVEPVERVPAHRRVEPRSTASGGVARHSSILG